MNELLMALLGFGGGGGAGNYLAGPAGQTPPGDAGGNKALGEVTPPKAPSKDPSAPFQLPTELPKAGVTVTHGPNEWLNYLHYVGAPKMMDMPEGWKAPGAAGMFAPKANWQWPPAGGTPPSGTTPSREDTNPLRRIPPRGLIG